MPSTRIPGAVMRLAAAGLATGTLATRPAAGAWAAARRVERGARRQLASEVGRRKIVLLDEALTSVYTAEAVARLLDSDAATRAVDRAPGGRLVPVITRDLVRFEVVERRTHDVMGEG